MLQNGLHDKPDQNIAMLSMVNPTGLAHSVIRYTLRVVHISVVRDYLGTDPAAKHQF